MPLSQDNSLGQVAQSDGKLSDWIPAIGVSLAALMFGVMGVYAPPKAGEMAVVFPPGTSEGAAYSAIVDAGGRIVSTSRFDNIIIAYALDEGFRDRIGQHGGWFTLAATGLCSPINSATST